VERSHLNPGKGKRSLFRSRFKPNQAKHKVIMGKLKIAPEAEKTGDLMTGIQKNPRKNGLFDSVPNEVRIKLIQFNNFST